MAEAAPDRDLRKCGVLRKWKSLHRRYCVLRAASESGPARLELYENEKKFRARGAGLRRALSLSSGFTVNKRSDSRSPHLVCVYTRTESLCLAADGAEEQESWYRALSQLLHSGKDQEENGDSNYTMVPGPPFKEVWQVNLRPRGLGQSRNMSGIYRLCLTDRTINLVKLNSEVAAVVLQLLNIRRCGHSENFFFVEVGRSAVTGPGEFWMQVDDSVVAQNMHETILEAMKAMSEEFRLRSKSQSSSSNPISVPSRRHHLPNPPPSQVGFSARRSGTTSPGQRYSFARARTSSDGCGAASRPASADEAPASPSPGPPHRQRLTKTHPPLAQTRSTPDPVARRSPRAASPAPGPSPGGRDPGRARPPAPGSPCDRGFSSSSSIPSSSDDGGGGGEEEEEFGSSPGSCGGFPLPGPVGRQHGHDYIAMGRPASAGQGDPQRQRRPLRRACSRGGEEEEEEEEEEERGLSKRAWPGRVASRSWKAEGRPEVWRPPATPDPAEGGRQQVADNGYVAMLPGVVPGQGSGGDYMAMTPKGTSAPQQVGTPGAEDPHGSGYMLMSPSGSCSPDGWARPGGSKSLAGSGDYMNMSPASRSASSTPPSGRHPHPTPPRGGEAKVADSRPHCYHSLPRSYKQQPASAASSAQLSCCSSSSSSSTSSSSDSLGETESGQPPPASQTPQAPSRPGRRGGFSRPAGLYLDVARASTLPRRRENPLPSEPQSPGEYVSIEFRCEPQAPRPLARPASCVGGLQRLPLAASEYANVDFCRETPVAAPETRCRMRSPLPADGAETAYCPGAALPEGARDPADPPEPSHDPRQGARVVRSDPQGRRRHCSETFLTAPSTPVPAAPFADRVRRRGSASFEGGWLKDGNAGGAERGTAEEPCPGMSRHMSIGFENGLNYIDLDLGTDSSCVEGSASQPRIYTQANGSAALNTYASIDFHKSEELRSHKSNKEGNTF
ncbi:insulin receptor substrate 1-like isoform X2 [Carcharodon carcharias]|uniref:insulin receptor substrate 1-like isoform X2 n=1 Tax=Carcharodon carcharias TaxID=13397 RepID=UPI001B7F2415|nr:insulin receptor substrate 1-like isoform X2 [Carcharodon carcharias]